jgi:hypothetical protein
MLETVTTQILEDVYQAGALRLTRLVQRMCFVCSVLPHLIGYCESIP